MSESKEPMKFRYTIVELTDEQKTIDEILKSSLKSIDAIKNLSAEIDDVMWSKEDMMLKTLEIQRAAKDINEFCEKAEQGIYKAKNESNLLRYKDED